jgi:hypothetical protein
MQTIDNLLLPYAEFERSVRKLMSDLFAETCGSCTACCCRADICEETMHGAFLSRLLEQQGLKSDDMDERFGWLDLNGCSLEYGRPPVCYAYFCDELLARLPDEDARLAASVLGKLLFHVGQNALDEWHLVEIMDSVDLEKVDVNVLLHRLEEAQAAYEVVDQYFHTGRLSTSDHETLSIITTDDP